MKGSGANSTAKNRKRFLEKLAEERSIADACRAAGIGRRTAYNWRAASEEFKEEWDEVVEANIDELEAAALRRAVHGTEEPITDKDGEILGYRVKHETALTIFMLKANRPEKYHLEKKEAAVASGKSTGVLVAPETQTPGQWIEAQKGSKADNASSDDDNAES